MKRLIIFILLFLSAVKSHEVTAQQETLSAFNYVVIPERFDFQHESDQYKFNSLLKFLFNKHGFRAFFPYELPEVSRCDGLYAEIQQVSGFIWTELSIRLVDCDGVLFYQTKTGRSKLKNYAKSYVEALRMAFESIEILGVRQRPLDILQKANSHNQFVESHTDSKKPSQIKDQLASVISDRSLNQDFSQNAVRDTEISKDQTVFLGLLPDALFMNFKTGDLRFLLRRTDDGYQWYQESTQDLVYQGKFFVVDKTLFYEDKEGVRYTADYRNQVELVLSRGGKETVFQKIK